MLLEPSIASISSFEQLSRPQEKDSCLFGPMEEV